MNKLNDRTPTTDDAMAASSVEVIAGDELTTEELRDRLHLERVIERSFYEAGKALRELRDRRLYRSTHRTFEEYCQSRFGFDGKLVLYSPCKCSEVESKCNDFKLILNSFIT